MRQKVFQPLFAFILKPYAVFHSFYSVQNQATFHKTAVKCLHNNSVLLLSRCVFQLSRTFFHLAARHHDLMAAAHAFQAEVCSDTHDFPLATAARMRFFQFYDISYCVFIHSIFLFYLCLPFNMLCIILCLHLYLLKYRAQSLLYQKVCSCVHRCGGLVDKHELVSIVIVYEACRRIYRK